MFRLLSTKLQPPGGTIVTAPGLRSRVCGQSLRRVWPPNHFWCVFRRVVKFQVIIKCGTHTRLFETNRFRIVSDLWIDRGLKPILGTQNRRMTPSVPHRLSESRFTEKVQVEERTIFFSILPRLPAKLNVAKKSIFSKNSSRVPEHAATRG